MSAQLGRALIRAWSGRQTPPARSWRTQLSEMTRTGRGRSELAQAGVTPRSLVAWLSEDRAPNRQSRARIQSAYSTWFASRPRSAGPLPTTRDHVIYGIVAIGTDVRDRRPPAGFRISGADGDWTAITNLWRQGFSDPGAIADAFINDVIMADLDGISEESLPAFPGQSYSVELS